MNILYGGIDRWVALQVYAVFFFIFFFFTDEGQDTSDILFSTVNLGIYKCEIAYMLMRCCAMCLENINLASELHVFSTQRGKGCIATYYYYY